MRRFIAALLLAASLGLAVSANAAGLCDIVTKGSTDRSVLIDIVDLTDGSPETGVVFNTSGIDLEYRREGAASTDITEATLAALTTAHTDGGFLAVGNGSYRLDLPDAAFATGANSVLIHGTVTGMVVIPCMVKLVDANLEDATRLGLAALPNAAAAASGGLFTRGTGAGQINQDGNGRIDVNLVATSGDTGAADTLESYTDGTTPIPSNMTQISGDSGAADLLETAWDGTAGPVSPLGIVRQFTAQSASSTGLVMDTGAAFGADTLIGMTLVACGSTQGYCQSRAITDNGDATADTVVVDAWTVTPSGTVTGFIFGTAPVSGGAGGGDVNLLTVEGTDATDYFATLDDATLARLPAALVSGRMDSSTGAMAANVMTAAAAAADLGTELGTATWATTVRSLTIIDEDSTTLDLDGTPLGSLTGNVGGNVNGSVNSVNTNGISANSLAADAGTELATAAWAAATRTLTSGLNIALAKGTGVTGFNDIAAADVRTQANGALDDNFLNYLVLDSYNPALPPGANDSIIEQLIENGGGVARFSTHALENAPAGGGGGGSDWSAGEKEQIRHRLGVDGVSSAPTATPSLATAASVTGLPALVATAVRDGVSEDQGNVARGCIEAVMLSFAAGDIVTVGNTTTWKDPSNGETRITSIVTSNGNRTATISCPTY